MLCFYKNSKNQYRVFKFKFFSLFFFLCVSSVFIIFHSHFWLSPEQQSGRGHTSIRLHISIKLQIITMKLWQKSRYDAILNFPKNWLILSYLGVTLSSCYIKDNFCFTYIPLWSQNSNFSVVMLVDLIKCNVQVWKTNRSNTRLFSVGKEKLS